MPFLNVLLSIFFDSETTTNLLYLRILLIFTLKNEIGSIENRVFQLGSLLFDLCFNLRFCLDQSLNFSLSTSLCWSNAFGPSILWHESFLTLVKVLYWYIWHHQRIGFTTFNNDVKFFKARLINKLDWLHQSRVLKLSGWGNECFWL